MQGILQVDYFNAFNRTIFNGPDNNASDGTFAETNSEGTNNGAFNGTSNRKARSSSAFSSNQVARIGFSIPAACFVPSNGRIAETAIRSFFHLNFPSIPSSCEFASAKTYANRQTNLSLAQMA